MTRFVVVTPDSSDAEIQEAITHLRERQRKAVIASTRDELDAEMSELLDMLNDHWNRPGCA